jgi:hypothetical protein
MPIGGAPRQHSRASIRYVHQDAVVNLVFSIFNCLIFDSNVDGGMPSVAAASSSRRQAPIQRSRHWKLGADGWLTVSASAQTAG